MARRESPLDELIHISRKIGADPDLVQGGGGNTSVKDREGRRIFVKASGTALGDMDRRRGWAELDLEALRWILSRRELPALPPSKREAEVLRLLAGAVLRPNGARPSVESSLHALLDRVVIHTHPVGLNAFLCGRESRRLHRDLIGDLLDDSEGGSSGGALYIPYTDPGYVLAARVEREIEKHRARRGRAPAVVLLENHGLFVAAPEADRCLNLSGLLTGLGRKFIGGMRINSRAAPRLAAGGKTERLRRALLRGGAAPLFVSRDGAPVAAEFLGSPAALRAARRGAFTPDQIVYCRTFPLVLPGGPSGGAREGWEERAAGAVAAYRRKTGLDPRVLLVPGEAVYYAAPDRGLLRVVSQVYRSAMAALLHGPRAGGPRFLTRSQARFIEGWEVEAFRARLAAGGVKNLRRTRGGNPM